MLIRRAAAGIQRWGPRTIAEMAAVSKENTLRSRAALPGASSSSDVDDSDSGSASFVGNSPSTVLFFIALAVGVIIAFLFIFFTVRYFFRSKYGLHVYPLSHRNYLMGSSRGTGSVGMMLSNDEIQEHIDYIREHHFIRGDILERRLMGNHRRSHRNRGGRFSRMKRLSEQEVELLFPKKTYYDWLHGGQERDDVKRDGVLHEEHEHSNKDTIDLNEEQATEMASRSVAPQGVPKKVESTSIEMTEISNKMDLATTISENPDTQASNEDLHFTSGSCAICLEVIEDDDIVRGLICGHVFHANCLDPWLTKRRACCPMCKRDYFYKDENHNSLNNSSRDANQRRSSRPEGDNAETNSTSRGHSLDFDEIDIEAFRNDPSLQMMIQELVPVSERVRSILSNPDTTHLNIEQKANELVDAKYKNVFKRIWWKLMGISKEYLFNWAVLEIYYKYVDNRANTASGDNTANSNSTESNDATATPANTNSVNANTTNTDTSNTNTRANPATGPEQPSAVPDESGMFNSRDIVDQRV
ncbi:Piso0_002470 [Millerozyma farinosa CBS 7064]|uniref:Piso0_002470 protein n=1 Tax=Pichia sorbitophila (strain ATCC MYA-4447 / BCRC 22081 / CBS 7064 / NBRC 10061 / NRRL Y-12695) TaxID=559304 RepID=G8YF49_PICSO|nr:Piso0_002470 [Millerozyma farinosa CBS 7064]